MATDEGLQDIKGQQIDSNYDEVIDNFDSMGLAPELLRGTSRLHWYTFSLSSAYRDLCDYR